MTITIRSSCISVLLFTQAGIPEGQMWGRVVVTVVTTAWPRPALHVPQLSWDGAQENWGLFLGNEMFSGFFCFVFFFQMCFYNLTSGRIFGTMLRGAPQGRRGSVGTI